MAAPKDRFWAKVLFKEFIRHYRKLNDTEIVEDVKQSMDDLDDLNEEGSSFGAKMVKWSIERKDTPRAETARANGALGGRPPTNPETQQRFRRPKNKQEFADFVNEQDLHIAYARDWLDLHLKRNFMDENGKPLENWKGALINWCKSREKEDENA